MPIFFESAWRRVRGYLKVAAHLGLASCLLMVSTDSTTAATTGQVWMTTQDMTRRLAPAEKIEFLAARDDGQTTAADVTIRVDPQRTYQKMLGLGSSLEHTTCFNLMQLSDADRVEAVTKLVHPENGIGMNLMRICIGTPDFTGEPWYSYDDLPAGEKDPSLSQFSIEKDRQYVLPVLKLARETNPALLFFASPWSPPGWMKSRGSMIGGHLLPESYPAYANYFVKFVLAYEREGIPIHAITVQNEPGVDRQRDAPKWHYPSCRWTGEQERDFIRDHLGPAFRIAGIKTQIWSYDHNFNVEPTADGDDPGISYPRTVLADPQAAQYVSGVAFHGYAGNPDGMSRFLSEFPDRPVHFSEGSVFGVLGARRLIDLLSHGASSYNAWVTMIDTRGKPNNGPFRASRTCVMLDVEKKAVDYRVDYYLYGQFMKFIEREAVRIGTEVTGADLRAVAFRNPSGRHTLVVANSSGVAQEASIAVGQDSARLRLAPYSVATVVW